MRGIIFLLIFSLGVAGCATEPRVIYKTEYQIVKEPVMYRLSRPDRPKRNSLSVPAYLKEVLVYTEILEKTIDGTQKGK